MERTLLLVEDDPQDAWFTERAFPNVCPEVALAWAPDGEIARLYLSGEGEFADRSRHPFPALVLLDLKLPKIDGLELLAWIRGHPVFLALPVVVLTSSELPKDVARASELGVLEYHVKSVSPEALERAAASVCALWKRQGFRRG
jgi:CheY-like chemotaxis protein